MDSNVRFIVILIGFMLLATGCLQTKDNISENNNIRTTPRDYKINETTQGGCIKLTINGWEKGPTYPGVADLRTRDNKSGENYVTVDLTLANSCNKTEMFDWWLSTKIQDDQYYLYSPKIGRGVPKELDGTIWLTPWQTVRGRTVYSVPSDVTGLKFLWSYEDGEHIIDTINIDLD
jgi:hypothetical protein